MRNPCMELKETSIKSSSLHAAPQGDMFSKFKYMYAFIVRSQ